MSMVKASLLPAGSDRLAALGSVGHSSSVCSPGGGGGAAAGCGTAMGAAMLAAARAAQEVAVDRDRDAMGCMGTMSWGILVPLHCNTVKEAFAAGCGTATGAGMLAAARAPQ